MRCPFQKTGRETSKRGEQREEPSAERAAKVCCSRRRDRIRGQKRRLDTFFTLIPTLVPLSPFGPLKLKLTAVFASTGSLSGLKHCSTLPNGYHTGLSPSVEWCKRSLDLWDSVKTIFHFTMEQVRHEVQKATSDRQPDGVPFLY